jgi:membrane dipeptidase
MSDEAFWDVCRIAEKPFIASHSNARAVCAHPRNLSDDMLRAIAEAGGVCGLNFYPVLFRAAMRAPPAGRAACAHIKKTAGCEALAIGSDFDGYKGENEIKDISKLPLLEIELKKSGFSSAEIEKIFYKNALRVFRDCLA